MSKSENQPPRVFISHAGQDKERFVLEFAKRLRDKGIEAWLDIWEMNPGDSLVDKIFEQGLKDCDAMIVVLSRNSVNSKWVREELNAGMVKRIQGSTKLIPVRLDGSEVPECLLSTIWQDIADLDSYDQQFERVVNAIYGQYDKPPLGAAPLHARTRGPIYSGLTKIDSRVFGAACIMTIEQDREFLIAEHLILDLKDSGVSGEQVSESLEVLSHQHCIEPIRAKQAILAFKITIFGFERFLRQELPNFDSLLKRVSILLATNSADDTSAVAKELTQPNRVAAFFLDLLERKALIKIVHVKRSSFRKVYEVSPVLRRNGYE